MASKHTLEGLIKVVEWLKMMENRTTKSADPDSPMANHSFGWLWTELGVSELRRKRNGQVNGQVVAARFPDDKEWRATPLRTKLRTLMSSKSQYNSALTACRHVCWLTL